MTTPDDVEMPFAEVPEDAPSMGSKQRVRVKLYVHGGTISFSMSWEGSLTELWQYFTRNLAPRSGGIVVESTERFIHITHGSISAYEFAKEPAGLEGGQLCQVHLA